MVRVLSAFRGLYFATLLMLIGTGLLSTYLGLRLAADQVQGLWVGALTAAYYAGLVIGGKLGHRLIAKVGHIRAYVTCAGVVGAAVLGIGLLPWLPMWLALRVLIGMGMMCQYMVLESWLNEQAGPGERGKVFSGYMTASYLGLALGQVVLVVSPDLGVDKLMLVAICYALCLVPVAVTGKIHPAPLKPAPLEPTFFIQRIPQSLTTTLVAGLVIGSFYGLAPLYASAQGLPTERIGLFMACCIFAGLIAQWPIGWLSDRHDRSWLIRVEAIALTLAALPLAVLPHVPPVVLLPLGLIASLLQFVLYPLAVALSNDHIEGERRVSLSAMLLVTFGIGACIGPLVVGALMNLVGPNMLYAFVVLCGAILIWRIRPDAVTGKHLVDEAPLSHVQMPEGSTSSPLAAALDPRVDSQVVQEQMHSEPVVEEEPAEEGAPLQEEMEFPQNPAEPKAT